MLLIDQFLSFADLKLYMPLVLSVLCRFPYELSVFPSGNVMFLSALGISMCAFGAHLFLSGVALLSAFGRFFFCYTRIMV